MQPAWLFENDIFEEGIGNLVDEVRRQGFQAKIASTEDYRASNAFVDLFPPHSCVIFHGSLQFAEHVRRHTSWVPGLYYTRGNYDCTRYYPHLSDHLLAQDYCMLPYGDLRNPRKRDFLFQHFGIEDTFFVRPNAGNKIFTGQLVTRERYDQDTKLIGYYEIPPEELCVVSPPRNVVDEWRFILCDHKVIAGSQYRRNGRKDVSKLVEPDAAVLAWKVAELSFQPDRVWSLDICRTTSDAFYVLEIGSFSCAGLYLCSPQSVVECVSRVALEDWKAANGEDIGLATSLV